MDKDFAAAHEACDSLSKLAQDTDDDETAYLIEDAITVIHAVLATAQVAIANERQRHHEKGGDRDCS